MAAALPVLMIASAVIGAVSAIQQGQAAKAAADFNTQVANQNATLSRQNAAAVAQQQARENYLRIGAITAAQGHSGGTEAGSVLDVIGDTAMQGELQKQNIIYQGELQARGYGNTSALETFKGDSAVTSSYYKAGGALLQGAGDYYTSSNSTLGRRTPAPVEDRIIN